MLIFVGFKAVINMMLFSLVNFEVTQSQGFVEILPLYLN